MYNNLHVQVQCIVQSSSCTVLFIMYSPFHVQLRIEKLDFHIIIL